MVPPDLSTGGANARQNDSILDVGVRWADQVARHEPWPSIGSTRRDDPTPLGPPGGIRDKGHQVSRFAPYLRVSTTCPRESGHLRQPTVGSRKPTDHVHPARTLDPE